MNSKPGHVSKTPKTGKNTKRKKQADGSVQRFSPAFFKKNEFGLILLGALLLTITIFFVFFRSAEPPSNPSPVKSQVSSVDALEKRIAALEQAAALGKQNGDDSTGKTVSAVNVKELDNRITRLETAFLVKFESFMERVESLEKEIVDQKTASVPAKPVVKTQVKKQAPAAKISAKKAIKKEKKESMFHTVKKGETLYSISKKYKTTVPALRKLNNLSAKDKIYPGNNIIVR